MEVLRKQGLSQNILKHGIKFTNMQTTPRAIWNYFNSNPNFSENTKLKPIPGHIASVLLHSFFPNWEMRSVTQEKSVMYNNLCFLWGRKCLT